MSRRQDVERDARPRMRAKRLRFAVYRILWARTGWHILGGTSYVVFALWLEWPWLLVVALANVAFWSLVEVWRRGDNIG